MTRDKIKQEAFFSVDAGINRFIMAIIDRIYDSNKKEICGNCKFNTDHILYPNKTQCKNQKSLMFQSRTTLDFGCNKWEQK